MKETVYELEVRPNIPSSLSGLNELANNLLYSWDRNVRGLFYRLDIALWEQCEHNPKVFLRRVSQQVLEEAAADPVFMEEYGRVMASYQAYLKKTSNPEVKKFLNPKQDLVAYFCAEFGLHESFPIYSGGLGILAGDHCKAASDLGVPFIAVGLLYRQGYFSQQIDACGNQVAHYYSTRFSELPIEPAVDAEGEKITITVELPGRDVELRAWKARAGHINMYLLDSNLDANSEEDRRITFQLYGGDKNTRIQQEIVLGIGGVKLLRRLQLAPSAWHINEGHAAFQIIERVHELIAQYGLDFHCALEQVAAGTVFTTHTPVPAGHDIFEERLIQSYFQNYLQKLNISFQQFMELGKSPLNHGSFNMTALALRGSRFHNGVSRIHGGVSSNMESYVWPQIPQRENPITYVTNGVHVPTFLAREWVNLFDMRFKEWRNKLTDEKYWQCIDDIPDHRFWSLRQELKAEMLDDVFKRTLDRYHRNNCNEALIRNVTEHLNKPDSDMLILGFARRFATYKRATLLFSDPERLARLLNDPQRPVMLIFAGKAHPKDEPGQDLVRTIHNYAHRPEFLGKIILLEGYNMAMARKLVTGVDVWLNTPEYPLEASGTSGQKAAINGVINLSVLDGWWGEGYNGINGWAITPHGNDGDAAQRDHAEANDLLEILEQQVIPSYYDRGNKGYSKTWVRMSKESMKSCIPRFNSARMVMDYIRKLYTPARDQYARLSADDFSAARSLSQWKQKIVEQWQHVRISRIDNALMAIQEGESAPIKVKAYLNGLDAEDVAMECMVGIMENGQFMVRESLLLQYQGKEGDDHIFYLDLKPAHPGLNHYKLRMYPYHANLSHPLEAGCMIWL